MPWNSNLWNSKAEKEKFPEQKNTEQIIITRNLGPKIAVKNSGIFFSSPKMKEKKILR